MSVTLGVIAASYGVFMAAAPVLQIRRMLQTGSSMDVSLGSLGVLEIGFALWFVYGLALPNWAIVVPNAVAFIVGLATIAVALRLRRAPRSPCGP